MNKYSEQIELVKNHYDKNPKKKANLAKRVRHRVKNFSYEARKHAAKAELNLINSHDWMLAEGEFLNLGLFNKIMDYVIWSKSAEVK
jgi:hypothetical protein